MKESRIRARLGTTAHFCEVVILKFGRPEVGTRERAREARERDERQQVTSPSSVCARERERHAWLDAPEIRAPVVDDGGGGEEERRRRRVLKCAVGVGTIQYKRIVKQYHGAL